MKATNADVSKPHVLICTEDSELENELSFIFELHGVNCTVATNLSEVEHNMVYRPKIVVVDDRFLSIEGAQCCQKIEQLSVEPNIEIWMLVSDDSAQAATMAYLAGATDFESKCHGFEQLAVRMAHIISRKPKATQLNMKNISFEQAVSTDGDEINVTKQLVEQVKHNLANQEAGAVFRVKIDEFDQLKHLFGYQGVDIVMELVKKRLISNLRQQDLSFIDDSCTKTLAQAERFGSKQLLLFINRVSSADSVARVAQRLSQCLSAPMSVHGLEITISCSIGIAMLDKQNMTVEALLTHSEHALSQVNHTDGENFVVYKEGMITQTAPTLCMEQELRLALESNRLEVHYQPQVNIVGNSISGLEALCRWHHPQLGSVSPADFIPLAERTGLINRLGESVLDSVCRQAKIWLDNGVDFGHIAVNVSALQFHQEGFVNLINEKLETYQIPANKLELELTEGVIMGNVEENIKKLNALKYSGVSIAVDDFGTGYSSLSYLSKLPINKLKIDRSFISNASDNSTDGEIVDVILDLAQRLSLKVVAEGVETTEQLNYLRNSRCQDIQGFLFSPALPADELESYFNTPKSFAVTNTDMTT